ncbi:MAG: hypothetical protein HFH09_01945 [Bacilli bacterium]|nr:hypothetical protein [Bacilli bacterium]
MIKQSSNFLFRGKRIRYAKYIQTFVGHEKAHFFVLDLREEKVREQVLQAGILTEDGYEEFASEILFPIYRQEQETLQYNLNLVFLLPDEMQLTSDMWDIKENFRYMRKLFLKASEFSKILFENKKRELGSIITVGAEKYKLRNFNVVSDSETKSSLAFLRELSEVLKSPIVQVGYPTEESYIQNIQSADQDILTYYYQKLWSMFQELGLPNNPYQLSSTEERCLYLASILSNQEKGQPLLLDGIGWGSLDDNRRLNMISTLSDFSEQSGSVIMTCDSKANNDLIKKKVYRANFLVSK